MPLTPQQRSAAILGGVFGGGLLITFLLVSLVTGDDDTKKVSIGPDQPTSSSSSTSSTLPITLPPTTLAPVTTGATSPPNTVSPGTIVVIPTAGTTPTTAPTTSTTQHQLTVAEELEELLEAELNGGTPPPDGTPPRVKVAYDKHDFIRVTWALDDSLSDDEQKYAAREEAYAILRVLKSYDKRDDERVVLRATLPDPDPDEPPVRVVRLVYENDTMDNTNFDTLDPLTVFETPPADDADIDPSLEPTPPPTTTSSTTTTTT